MKNNRLALRFGILLISTLSLSIQTPATPPGQTAARSATRDSAQFLTWTYQDAPMGLYLPASTGGLMPVVMFLHGCNNDPVYAGHWIISALNAIEPTVVFLPTALATPNTQYSCADWGGNYDAQIRPQMQNALHELDSLILALGLSTTRQYLYGESMGGEGVYRLITDFPTRFAGAVTVGGYTPNKGAAQMAKTPLWILIGTEDEMSPIADTRAIHEAIVQAGGEQVEYTEYPGLGHVPAIEQARTESDILVWLLGQTRSASARVLRDRDGMAPSKAVFTVVDGILHLSSALPPNTRLVFSGIDGSQLLEIEAGGAGIRLPANLRNRVAFWRATGPGFSLSGRMALLP